ncbi:MAG: hypothetical protein ACFFCW_37890 [Candidatus Hodarchaeota archaeon]
MDTENSPNESESWNNKELLLDGSVQRQLASIGSVYRALNEQVAFLSRINLTVQMPRIHIVLPTIDTSILDEAIKAAQKIGSILEPFHELRTTVEEISRQFQVATQGLDAVMKHFVAEFAAIDSAFRSISSSDIFKRLSEFVRAQQEAIDAFRAAGWPIAPSMPVELRERVVGLHRQGKTRYASQSIMGYYRRNNHENLIQMVDNWEGHPLFRLRMHIIRDALDAHREGKYTLSVPALIPQIEGILNDYVRQNNLAARFGKIREVYTAAIGNPEHYGLAEWAIVQTLLYQLQTNTYMHTDFEDELRRVARNRQTTRHTILHGIATEYNRQIHSLKVFLLLDAVSALESIAE